MTEDVRSVMLQTHVEQTELGMRVTVHCPTVHIIYEFDLDDDPELLMGIIQNSPQIIQEQVERFAREHGMLSE